VRPLGVVEGSMAPSGALYVGIHQAVLGEVGYKSDTRVSGVRAVVDPSLARWWTTAHLADSLTGSDSLEVRTPDVGPAWVGRGLVRQAAGACGEGEATGYPHEPTGLLRATVVVASTDACVALRFRVGDTGGWRFQIGPDGATLSSSRGQVVRMDGSVLLARGRRHVLQVRDDGQTVEAFLDGVLLFDGVVAAEPGDRDERGVGFALSADAGSHIARFEAHPRAVEIAAVVDAPRPWTGSGEEIVDVGDFAGPAGPLDEPADDGRPCWTRLEGAGVFERTGDGRARVRATREVPNPGRTIYGVPWAESVLADVTVTLTPPGTQRGEGHWGLSGLAFWQDRDNYLIVHQCLGDTNTAISVNSFLRVDGVEEMCEHDCVWTNVTGHVMHGVPMALRVVFDGLHYVVYTDDEMVLARAVTDLKPGIRPLIVHQVGLVANWDWGDDTGTVFSDLTARR
jgi:hypothetical protein